MGEPMFRKIEERIGEFRQKYQPERVVTVGNSMGGYAAILVGHGVAADRCVAFAPQTTLDPSNLIKWRDWRWPKQRLKAMKNSLFLPEKQWDLRRLFLSSGRKLNADIFFDPGDKLDAAHATHLRELPGISVHQVRGAGHNIIKEMRDDGRLATVLQEPTN